MSKIRKERLGPEWDARADKHNVLLEDYKKLVTRLVKNPSEQSVDAIKRLESMEDKLDALRDSLGSAGKRGIRPPSSMRQKRPNRGRPQDK